MTEHAQIQPGATPSDQSPASGTPSLGLAMRRWVLRPAIAALLISLAVHLLLLIIAAVIIFSRSGGEGQGPGRPTVIEFAVMPDAQLESVSATELTVQPPSAEELLNELLEPVQPANLSVDLTSPLSQESLSLDVQTTSGGGELSVDGVAGGGAGSSGASFFGIEARGNRFAYVVDVSGSMATDDRLAVMIDELSTSVTQLLEHTSFYVVLYSDDAIPLGNRRQWTDASSAGKRWARGALGRVEPLGSTRPLPAFELVFQARPRPDAIYFMTDGEFDEREANRIIALASEFPTPIHCITFVTQGAEATMRRIAQSSGGTYTHIPGQRGGRP